MKNLLKYTGLPVLMILVSIFGYYILVVSNAKSYTKKIILEDLQKGQWRHPNGIPHKFELRTQELSKRQKEILIKVQDPGFYSHSGIDLSTPGAGLTTITQAIVKKLYFKNFEPGIAKIKQSLIAKFVVDDLISKNDQLTIFINAVYFGKLNGKPVDGLETAAHAYFNRSVKMLTDDQYISLIAMIVMPGTFHLIDHPEWNRNRADRIKAVVSGAYKPKGLMDQFYGDLPREVVDSGLPPAAYFGDLYKGSVEK